MTNAGLQAMIQEYGDKIFCIILDNARKLFIGVDPGNVKELNSAITLADLTFKTFDGVDMFGIHHRQAATWDNINVPYVSWMITGCIQSVHITDECGQYLPDINKFY